MLLGNAAQRPQGVLQPFRQRDKTFAAEHDMGVFEAGKGQTEVIEPAVEQLAGDGDAKIGDLGEVRQPHAARRMLLAEDHLPIRAVHRPPRPDPPLQRPPRPGAQSPDADGIVPRTRRSASMPGAAFSIGRTLVLPDTGEWIGSPAFAGRLLLGWESGSFSNR